MEPVLETFIRKVAEIAKADSDRQQLRNELNTLWNGVPNWDALISQEAIDTVQSFHAAGVTVQMVADVIYCEAQAKQIIDGNVAAFFVMASIAP